jgi:hypothetical protein
MRRLVEYEPFVGVPTEIDQAPSAAPFPIDERGAARPPARTDPGAQDRDVV